MSKACRSAYIIFDGALVYDIKENSFIERCRFKNEDINYGYMGIKRIIYIGDYFYTFSDQSMTVYDGRTGDYVSNLNYSLNIK